MSGARGVLAWAVLWAAACGGGADTDAGAPMDGGRDAGSTGVCGDGTVDPGEACDDGDDVAFDGCEPDCTFTCARNSDCDDSDPCNGNEACSEDAHVCEPGGLTAPAGSACSSDTIATGLCNESGRCIPAGCGNGTLEAGEDCDDMNDVAGDGCEPDCQFTCAELGGCDLAACLACDVATHTCGSITPVPWFVDCDGDGYASGTSGSIDGCAMPTAAETGCGTPTASWTSTRPAGPETTDCNEEDPTVIASLAYYADCDRDGYAAAGTATMRGCVAPTTAPATCGSGLWTTEGPVDLASTDCDDTDGDLAPGATELPGDGVDSDCDGTEVCFADEDGDGYRGTATIASADADCDDPDEFTETDAVDCDDTTGDAAPGNSEACDPFDNDCDGNGFNGCPAAAPTLASVRYESGVGMTSGGVTTRDLACPSGSVLVGIDIWAVGPPGGSNGPLVPQVRGVCRSAIVVETAASPEYEYRVDVSGAETTTATSGVASGSLVSARCPSGTLLVGIAGRHSAGALVRSLGLICANVPFRRFGTGWRAVYRFETPVGPYSAATTDGVAFSSPCYSEDLATVLRTYTIDAQSGLLGGIAVGCARVHDSPR